MQDTEKNISFRMEGKMKLWEADFDQCDEKYEIGSKIDEGQAPSKVYFAS